MSVAVHKVTTATWTSLTPTYVPQILALELIRESSIQRNKRKALVVVNGGRSTTREHHNGMLLSAPKGYWFVLFKLGVESTPVHIFEHSLQ